MTTPTELILQRLEEIALQLRTAFKNGSETDNLMELYNQYYYAAQLLDSHCNVPQRFCKLTLYKNNGNPFLRYSRVYMKPHIASVKEIKEY